MVSHHSHGNTVASVLIGIVVTFVSVMSQSDGIRCPKGCNSSVIISKNAGFEIRNFSSSNNLSNCIPHDTQLRYICKDPATDQFDKQFNHPEQLLMKCTGNGWMDGFDNKPKKPAPFCVKRKKHCLLLPDISNGPNILIQIGGQNINIADNNMTSLFYSEGTKITYKCKNAEESQKKTWQWQCNKNNKTNFSWAPINKNHTNPQCDVSILQTTVGINGRTFAGSTSTAAVISNTPSSIGDNGNQEKPSSDKSLLRNLLIGICSFLGFALIGIVIGVCVLRKNRTILEKYKNDFNYAKQPSWNSIPEETNNKPDLTEGEENNQYVNIIPIKVNQETIYAEIEIGSKSDQTLKRNIIDDESTVYVEIHHSAIAMDEQQRR